MGGFVAKDAVIRMAAGGERKRIGGGAIKDKEDLAMRLKHVTQQVGSATCPRIIAVTTGVAVVGFLEGGPRFGADAGIIVAGELAAVGWFVHQSRFSRA